jgi:hypothetical protein
LRRQTSIFYRQKPPKQNNLLRRTGTAQRKETPCSAMALARTHSECPAPSKKQQINQANLNKPLAALPTWHY